MFQKKFDMAIKAMYDEGLSMDSVKISIGDNEFFHQFPEGTQRKNIRSISKPITALCVGIAIAKGYFADGIYEPVMRYFSDYKITNKDNLSYLEEEQIRHILTLTFGHDVRTMNSNQMKELVGVDLCQYTLDYPIVHRPGDFFLYTNSPVYLMSVILQKKTGMKLVDFAKKYLFAPMEIESVTWTESEQGYNMGCTGLDIAISDLHKVGKLLLNDGVYNGKQIVPAEWVKSMKTLQVNTPTMFDPTRVLPKFGYGYNLWICENGNFYCDGTDGQYLIVVPEKDMVITTMGFQKNMKPITECLRSIILD